MKKGFPIIGFIIAAVIVFGGLAVTRNIGKSDREISIETAEKKLDKMVSKIRPYEGTPVKSAVEYTNTADDGTELPEIDDSSISVKAVTKLYAEIDSSPEKAGSGPDGWLVDMANQFNSAGYEVNGQKVSIQLRNLSSGLVMDYIRTGKYVPDGFTPSNSMWVSMLEAYGVDTVMVSPRMVGNTAVILMENKKYKEFVDKYGAVDLKSVVEATEAGEFTIGYTNPFVSSVGLNFLVSTLQRYDGKNPLSAEAADGFSKFQNNIPFVAFNTIQMREAAKRGTLDGFVFEMQSYNNDSSLKRNYTATPFGYRHDNPLITFGTVSPEKQEIVRLFAQLCDSDAGQKLATEYGFNDLESYKNEQADLDGNVLREAQQLYKESKDAGKEVIAVFVADVSGSMDGAPLNSLKQSLINSIQYISPGNYIGLVSYSDDVTIEVPIRQFDLEQQAYFKGGVEGLYASGTTATYDATAVALSMINEEMKNHENAKPIVFVLSDGLQNSGYSLGEVKDVVKGMKVPIYTINYNDSGAAQSLQSLSDINEAASINANSDDVVYQLKNLLNASM